MRGRRCTCRSRNLQLTQQQQQQIVWTDMKGLLLLLRQVEVKQ
jgi:hypothetical protein